MDLNGKIVVYVGGFGGIGLATCQALINKSISHLFILDKNVNSNALSTLQSINSNVQVHFLTFDATWNRSDMRKVFQEIFNKVKNIDLLINGAGILNEHEIELTIQINLIGLINTTTVAFEFLDKRHGGNGGLIVNIASVSGLNPYASLPVYSATKSAVIAFTYGIAQLKNVTGVDIIAICPGITETPLVAEIKTYIDIEPNLASKFVNAPKQTAEVYAKNLMIVIEKSSNGDTWVLNTGKYELTTLFQRSLDWMQ